MRIQVILLPLPVILKKSQPICKAPHELTLAHMCLFPPPGSGVAAAVLCVWKAMSIEGGVVRIEGVTGEGRATIRPGTETALLMSLRDLGQDL